MDRTFTYSRIQEYTPTKLQNELKLAQLRADRLSSRNARQFEITAPQLDVICTIANSSELLTFSQISDATQITRATLTGLVKRLEEKKMVKLHKVKRDGRSKKISLLQRGLKVFQESELARKQTTKNLFSNLSIEEQQALQELLYKSNNGHLTDATSYPSPILMQG